MAILARLTHFVCNHAPHWQVCTSQQLQAARQAVLVEEPSGEEAVELLAGLRPRYEAFHRVTYTDAALREAVSCAQRSVCSMLCSNRVCDHLLPMRLACLQTGSVAQYCN